MSPENVARDLSVKSVPEEDPDVIHFDNSSNLPLSTSFNDLDNATLHIDCQSTEVDVPPDIIDLNEDDDIIDDEDALPHDLADSDDEDLVNVDDDDGVDVMSADVARGHGGDGDDRPPTHHIPTGCGDAARWPSGTPKTQVGWNGKREAALPARRPRTRFNEDRLMNQRLRQILRFEWDDKKTMDASRVDHGPHWSNYLGESCIWEMPLYTTLLANKGPAERTAQADRRRFGTAVGRVKPHMLIPALDNGYASLPFGMIPETKPEPLKISKTGQRARLYADSMGEIHPLEVCSTVVNPHLLRDITLLAGISCGMRTRALSIDMLRLCSVYGSNTETGCASYNEMRSWPSFEKGKEQLGTSPVLVRVMAGTLHGRGVRLCLNSLSTPSRRMSNKLKKTTKA
ncbi:hypothetical protein Tco_1175883 [Tanacetum coccineum]